MSLGKDELVVASHDPMVQGQQEIEGGKVASDVADTALEVHLEQTQPGFPQNLLQRRSPF
jgi:hypothetical protein